MTQEPDTEKRSANELSQPLLAGVGVENEVEVLPTSSNEHPVGDASQFATWINIVKTFVGAGSFSLPIAFKDTGIVLGIIGVIAIAFLANYTMKVLVDIKFYMVDKMNFKKEVKYSDLGQAAAGTVGMVLVYSFVLMTNIGVCMAYIVFSAGQVNSISKFFGADWNVRLICLGFFPVCFLLSFIRNFKWLAPVSVLGSLTLLASVIMILSYGIAKPSTLKFDDYNFANFGNFPSFFASACFLFCTHTMTLPLNASMREPRKYWLPLNIAFLGVGTMNLIFSIVSYILLAGKLTDEVHMIFDVLPNTPLLVVIQVALVLELLATFPAVLLPVIQYLEFSILGIQSTDSTTGQSFGRFCVGFTIRFVVVLIVIVLAASVKIFQSAVNLVGALTAATTGFILPPLLRMLIRRHDKDYKWWLMAFDVAVVFVAIILTKSAVVDAGEGLWRDNKKDLVHYWHKSGLESLWHKIF